MSNRKIPVETVLKIFALHHAGHTNKAISALCGVSQPTVSNYLKRFKRAGLPWPLPEGFTEDELWEKLYPSFNACWTRSSNVDDFPEKICSDCGQKLKSNGSVNYGDNETGYKDYCNKCFNEMIANSFGLDYSHVDFPDISIMDADGKPHKFKFESRMAPGGLVLEALEVKMDLIPGYHIEVMGDPEDKLFLLYNKLLGKMRRVLTRKHIEEDDFGWYINEDHTVRGTIEEDDTIDGPLPGVVIDGKWFSWDELGYMVNTYQGFSFKLVMIDGTDDDD